MNPHLQQIEALLFYLNEEVSKVKLAKLVGVTAAELQSDIDELQLLRKDSGIVLIQTSQTVHLGTHVDAAKLIESVTEAESVSPLSKAAMETLAVVAYRAPIMRAEIDSIRGVNSLYSLRNLLVRGLISRRNEEGHVVYEPTVETYQLLGVTGSADLPNKSEIDQKINQIMNAGEETETEETPGEEKESH